MQVTLIDFMGSDDRVADAARVSFHKEASNYTKDQNQGLINFLARNNHFTPFTHVQITLREKVPIFVARQRFKHMVGFSYNEVSRRYVDDAPEFFTPDTWRKRPEGSVKQGSSDEFILKLQWEIDKERYEDGWIRSEFATKDVKELYLQFLDHAEWLYNTMIENEVAPEQARMVLPQSMYTEYYTTGSLAAWARAYKLRIDPHAQKEIQDLAKMWQDTIGNIKELDYSWKALTE